MAVRTRSGGTGIEVVNLSESLRALKKFGDGTDKEVKGVLREQAKKVRDQAWGLNPGGARSNRNITSKTKMFGYSVTNKGAGIKLRLGSGPKLSPTSRVSWAAQMEFGENITYIPDTRGFVKARRTGNFKRPQTRPHKPPSPGGDLRTNRGGYMIQPTLRKQLPKIEEEVTDDLIVLFNKTQRNAGVKRVAGG